MRNIHVTIVAGAALLCSAMLAVAQEREQRGQDGPAAKQGGPPSGAGPERAGPPSRGPGIERGEGRGMREPRTDMPQRREPAARNTEERGRRTPNQIPNQAERKERPDQAIERGRQEGSPPAAGQKERERFDRTDRRPTQGAQRKPGEQPAAQTVQRQEQIRQTRSRLSNEQQVRLRSSFDVRRDRVTKADFAVELATRIRTAFGCSPYQLR